MTTATMTTTMPRPTPIVQRRENGHRRRFRRGVRKSPGWVAPLPEVTHSDWLAASLRGSEPATGPHRISGHERERPRRRRAATPVGGEGLAGTVKLVVVPVPTQLIVSVKWWRWLFSAFSVA